MMSNEHALCGWKRLYWPSGVHYLTRIFVQCTAWCVYLHRVHNHDPDRHVHSHPRPMWSLILRGGYVEMYMRLEGKIEHYGYRRFRAGQLNVIRPDEYHRIVEVLPGTWTLVIGGRRFREWGFWVRGKHIAEAAYLKEYARV